MGGSRAQQAEALRPCNHAFFLPPTLLACLLPVSQARERTIPGLAQSDPNLKWEKQPEWQGRHDKGSVAPKQQQQTYDTHDMKTSTLLKSIAASMMVGTLGVATPEASALTATDVNNVLFLKQEEKLARDIYLALHAQWGHQTFLNISASEQQHMNAVDGLIERYGLTDTTPSQPGKFSIPELQALYDDLVARGSQSLADALSVGVAIEELDIADIQEMLDTTRERPILRVLGNLQAGSYNHLDAFTRALAQIE